MEPAEYDLMDAREGAFWWYRALHARALRALTPVAGGRVLDAGCGTGGLLAALARDRPDLRPFGIEHAFPASERARAKSGAAVACGSVDSLPFADGSFDAAIAADVLCHARVEPALALDALWRALRPGGLLVVNMPAYRWLLSDHDRRVHNVRRATAAELRRMLARAGFTAIEARYWNTLLLPLMIAERKLPWPRTARPQRAAVPPWIDKLLHAVTQWELEVPFGLPAGGSVLATARRPI